jgi:hypothetical protein
MKICIACLHVGQMLFAGNISTAEKDYRAFSEKAQFFKEFASNKRV